MAIPGLSLSTNDNFRPILNKYLFCGINEPLLGRFQERIERKLFELMAKQFPSRSNYEMTDWWQNVQTDAAGANNSERQRRGWNEAQHGKFDLGSGAFIPIAY